MPITLSKIYFPLYKYIIEFIFIKKKKKKIQAKTIGTFFFGA